MGVAVNYKGKGNWQQVTADIISGLVLVVFLYTAWSKLRGYEQFKFTLSQSPLLAPVAGIVAWALPATELVIVVLLFIPAWRRLGLWASAVLIAIFTVYLGYMVVYTPKLPCTCGGVLAELSWRQHIAFNVFMVLVSVTGIALYKKGNAYLNKSPPI